MILTIIRFNIFGFEQNDIQENLHRFCLRLCLITDYIYSLF